MPGPKLSRQHLGALLAAVVVLLAALIGSFWFGDTEEPATAMRDSVNDPVAPSLSNHMADESHTPLRRKQKPSPAHTSRDRILLVENRLKQALHRFLAVPKPPTATTTYVSDNIDVGMMHLFLELEADRYRVLGIQPPVTDAMRFPRDK
jgi:hypothetical protein